MVKAERDFPRSRKIRHRYAEEIQNVGVQVHRDSDGCNLKKLIDSISDSNLIDHTMYHHFIGSLVYLTKTRPDICFDVNALSQFTCELRQIH